MLEECLEYELGHRSGKLLCTNLLRINLVKLQPTLGAREGTVGLKNDHVQGGVLRAIRDNYLGSSATKRTVLGWHRCWSVTIAALSSSAHP